MAEDHGPVEISASRARQARQGLPVLWVLVISLSLAAIVLFVVWMAHSRGFSAATRKTALQPSQAASFSPPPGGVQRAPPGRAR
ncbi:MAG: hypothetical protein ACYC8V_13520 [Caulobacteraceae bacterium]